MKCIEHLQCPPAKKSNSMKFRIHTCQNERKQPTIKLAYKFIMLLLSLLFPRLSTAQSEICGFDQYRQLLYDSMPQTFEEKQSAFIVSGIDEVAASKPTSYPSRQIQWLEDSFPNYNAAILCIPGYRDPCGEKSIQEFLSSSELLSLIEEWRYIYSKFVTF